MRFVQRAAIRTQDLIRYPQMAKSQCLGRLGEFLDCGDILAKLPNREGNSNAHVQTSTTGCNLNGLVDTI